MDDERLLAEALRAHAAGGVSSPGGGPAPGAPAPPDGQAGSGASRLRDRFRPLGRRRGAESAGPTETHARPTGAAAVPSAAPPSAVPFPAAAATRGGPPPGVRPGPPASAVPARPWPQTGPRPASRPAPPVPPGGPGVRPGPPGVPYPRPAPATGATTVTPTGAGRPPGADRSADGTEWTTARVAWWSGIALLAGAIAGALTAVGTLALPG